MITNDKHRSWDLTSKRPTASSEAKAREGLDERLRIETENSE
jgi:hypothetical protein